MAKQLMMADRYPQEALTVRRIFTEACPGVDLIDFNVLRGGWRDDHWVRFCGAEADLRRYGLLTDEMIPTRPKLKKCCHLPDRLAWNCRRRAKGRFEVTLYLDEDLPRQHVLAPLATWRWPFVARPNLRLVIDNTRRGAELQEQLANADAYSEPKRLHT